LSYVFAATDMMASAATDVAGIGSSLVGRADRVGVDEPGVAGLFNEVDPDGADVVGDALAFIEVVGHPLGVGQGSGEVDYGPCRPPRPDRPGELGEDLHGCFLKDYSPSNW
jgi:hypothetical protein